MSEIGLDREGETVSTEQTAVTLHGETCGDDVVVRAVESDDVLFESSAMGVPE